MNMSFGQFPTTLAALAVVIGLIWLSARFARSGRFGRAPSGGGVMSRLVLENTIQLDRQRRLHVVRCDGQGLVLLTGGSTDVVIRLAGPLERELAQ